MGPKKSVLRRRQPTKRVVAQLAMPIGEAIAQKLTVRAVQVLQRLLPPLGQTEKKVQETFRPVPKP